MDAEARVHQETWALLPWLANGSASPEHCEQAERHLRACAACRAELARERQLVRAMSLPPLGSPDAEQGLQRLLGRLDQPDGEGDQPGASSGWRALAGMRVGVGRVAALALAEALLVAGLVWVWLHGPMPADPAPYRTLTQVQPLPAGGPHWRVVLEPGRTIGELQALLAGEGLAIVAGPSEAGVFTLGAAPGAAPRQPAEDADAVAARLRAAPGVVFAEAAGGP